MDQNVTGQGRRPAAPPLVARRPRFRPEPLTGTPPPPTPRAPQAAPWPDEPYVARWVPVPEPRPRNAAERLARKVRRFAFPLAALGLSAAVAALVWAGRSGPDYDYPLPLPPELRASTPVAGTDDARAGITPPARALTIETLPEGAMVTVERMPLGPSPVRTPGLVGDVETLAVRVEKEGYRTLDTLLSPAREGSHTRLALVPRANPSADPASAPVVTPPLVRSEPVAARRADPAPAPAARRTEAPARPPVATRRAVEPAPRPAQRAARAPERETVATATRAEARRPVRAAPILVDRPANVPPTTRAEPTRARDARPEPVRSEATRSETARSEASGRREPAARATSRVTPAPAPDDEPIRITATPARALGTVHVLVRSGPVAETKGTRARRASTQRVYSADLPAGRRRIRVDHPTLGRWEREVVVRAGQEQTVVVDVDEWARGRQ